MANIVLLVYACRSGVFSKSRSAWLKDWAIPLNAAAIAFLIAGPTTTLPAMAAVWGLTTRRVFFLYLSFVLVGAIVFGYLYSLAGGLIG